MSDAEARKVIAIMCMADSGCSNCVGELLDQFKKEFPQFAELAERAKTEGW